MTSAVSSLASAPARPRSTLWAVLLLWLAFYGSFTLWRPALLDDADSVHVEVAREMLLRHDYVTLYANGVRYLEKAPLLYWGMAGSMRVATLFGVHRPSDLAAAARVPLALAVLALGLCCEAMARSLFHSTRAGLYSALILLSSFGIFIFTRITIPDALVCLWITIALRCFWRTEELHEAASNSGECCAAQELVLGLRWQLRVERAHQRPDRHRVSGGHRTCLSAAHEGRPTHGRPPADAASLQLPAGLPRRRSTVAHPCRCTKSNAGPSRAFPL